MQPGQESGTDDPAAPRPLIGLAHGSREPRAAEVIGDLMDAVAVLRPGLKTVAAFLDLSAPDLTTALRDDGSASFVVLPLLFTEAFHARVDTPSAVAEAAEATGSATVVGASWVWETRFSRR